MTTYQERIPALLLSLLAVVPLFFRGLFFQNDLLIFAVIAMLFLLLAVVCRNKPLSVSLSCDLSLGLMVLFYFLSAVRAVNVNLAVGSFYQYLLFYLLYLSVKVLAKEDADKRTVLFLFVAGCTLMSLISLLSATGALVYPGAYSASEIEKWLNGTVQYHNAFGALTLAAFLMAAALLTGKAKQVFNILLACFAYFLMFGLIMSYSRGAWVLAPLLFLVYMLFADKEKRLSFFRLAIPALLAVGCVLSPFTGAVDAQKTGMALVWLLIGLVVHGVLYAAVSFLFYKTSETKYFNKIAIAAVAVAVLLLLAVVLFPQAFPFLPQQLTDRLSGINFQSETVKERFVFYQDAWQVAKNHLILGSGGGAWQDLYGQYQTYDYATTQAHSYLMQVLIETGLVGALLWIATIGLFLFYAIRAKREQSISNDVILSAVCGALTLILHSFIDFDLSIPAILLLLWILIALLASNGKKLCFRLPRWLTATLSILLIVLSVLLRISSFYGEKGEEALGKDYTPFALEYCSKATAFNPLNAVYLSDQAYALAKSNDPEGAKNAMARALALASSNIDVQQMGISVYSQLADYESALDCVKNTIRLQPMNADNYYAYLVSLKTVVGSYIGQDRFQDAKALCKEGLAIRETMQQASAGKPEAVTLPDDVLEEYTTYFNLILANLGD